MNLVGKYYPPLLSEVISCLKHAGVNIKEVRAADAIRGNTRPLIHALALLDDALALYDDYLMTPLLLDDATQTSRPISAPLGEGRHSGAHPR